MTEAVVHRAPDGETAQEAAAMAEVFATLASVFARPPDAGTVAAVSRLAAALGTGGPADPQLDELSQDYAALFAVPGPRHVAPYESVYRDPVEGPQPAVATGRTPRAPEPAAPRRARQGLLMGPSTLDVRRAQLEAGLMVERELPDHVANELWFVAHLWRKQACASPRDERVWAERRERFVREHLDRWLDDLLAEVRRNEHGGFYGAALQIVRQALELD